MGIVKIFAMVQPSKIGLAGIYYQTKLTFLEISKQKTGNKLRYHILYFLMHFQNVAIQSKTAKIKLILQYKKNHQDVIHTLLTVKTEDKSTNQIIRTKQSLLAGTRHYIIVKLNFSLFPLLRLLPLRLYIQILLCRSKCNTFTSLQLENVNTN